MAAPLPKDFVPLDVVPTRLDVDLNIIGVVTDFLAPAKSRGEDYMCSFTLCDQSPSPGQLVKFFRASIEALPRIGGNGDVVILRQVQTKSWSGLNSVLSNRYSGWAVIHGYSIPAKPSPGSIPQISKSRTMMNPAGAELVYAMALGNALSHHRTNYGGIPPSLDQLKASSQVVSMREGPKFSPIKDVEERRFYNIVGEVVKTWAGGSGGFELYVSDYTSHHRLFNYEWGQSSPDERGRYGDEFNYLGRKENRAWQGPYGKLTLEVVLWPPHSIAAQSNVKEGDYVELRNVKMKLEAGRLEGVIHTDKKYPDRIDVHVLNTKDDRVKDVLRAKQSYIKKFEAQRLEYLAITGTAAKRDDEHDEQNDPPKKRQKKTESKQKTDGSNAAKVQMSRMEETEEGREAKELAQRRKMERQKKNALAINRVANTGATFELNKHVASAHRATPVTPVSEILAGPGRNVTTDNNLAVELPFQNVCCRARVRVIDFFPPKLEDFAVPCDEFEDLSDHSGDESDNGDNQLEAGYQRSRRWEWMFYLLLQDATTRAGASSAVKRETMKVLITDKDAQYLLKMDANDLRRNPDNLDLLREKLYILWGDLEERKSSLNVSPFKETDPNKEVGQAGGEVPNEKLPAKRSKTHLIESSAMAFECCLREYGVLDKRSKTSNCRDAEDDGESWLRRFQMFGTTILW